MKTLLAILASMVVLTTTTQAQTHQPLPVVSPYAPGQPLWLASPLTFSPTFVPIDFSNRHLQLKTFSSIEAGMAFFKGGGGSYLSAPTGVVLARPLSNNVAAFSTLTVAPTIFSMTAFPVPGQNPYNLNLNARISGGLIYTNDARTFSISGSFSVEKGSYPIYAAPPDNRVRKSY